MLVGYLCIYNYVAPLVSGCSSAYSPPGDQETERGAYWTVGGANWTVGGGLDFRRSKLDCRRRTGL